MTTSTIAIGSFEAKTKLSELLERIGKNVSFTITKRSKPVAQFIDIEEEEARRRIEAGKAIRELSKNYTLGGLKIKDLIEEGRKW